MGIDFDGGNDALTCPWSSVWDSISTNQEFSISAWVKVATGFGSASYPKICQKGDNDEGGSWQLYMNGSSGILGVGVSFSSWHAGTAGLTENTWQHICATFSNSDMIAKIYVDYSTTDTHDFTGADPIYQTDDDVYIGNRAILQRGFEGIISDVAVWSKKLTDAEVELLAKSKIKGIPLQIQPSYLCAYWPLDDEEDGSSGNGDTFIDRSGNGCHMTGADGGDGGLTAKAEEVLSYVA